MLLCLCTCGLVVVGSLMVVGIVACNFSQRFLSNKVSSIVALARLLSPFAIA